MKITALDIHQKEFTHGMRGYKEDEVDDFLDLVANEFEALAREVAALRQRLAEEEAKAISLDAERNAINSALLIAQRSADDMLTKAKSEVEHIYAEAEAKGTQIVQDALTTKRELIGELKRLKDEEESFRAALKRMVGRALDGIEEVRLSGELESAIAPAAQVAEVVEVAEVVAEPAAAESAAPVAGAQTSYAAAVAAADIEAPVYSPAPAYVDEAPDDSDDDLEVVEVDAAAELSVDATAPHAPVSSGLIIGEVGAAPALNVELEVPGEFQFGGASVWGESDDDIEIEEID